MIGTRFRSLSKKGNPTHRVAFFLWAILFTSLPLAQVSGAPDPLGAPEAASGHTQKSVAVGRRFMAVTANPHATQAAQAVLRRGGNALDAALAAQWVLNVVEPQSSGIGGGAFLLFWDAKAKKLTAWDGRETAPADADSHFGQRADGSLANFDDLVATGQSVGTPGLVAMLAAAHRRHGRQPWRQSFTPAIRLAERGFLVSPRLHKLLAADKFLHRDATAAALYYPVDGQALGVGDVLKNPVLAQTFRRLAREGAAGFYRGPLAVAMAQAVRQRGGWLSLRDLAGYQARMREAVCGPYRTYRVCGMPPPSSGGIAVAQLLGILERSGPPMTEPLLEPMGGPMIQPWGIDSVHWFAEAGRLVFADRASYLADPDYVTLPQGLLDDEYLAQRASLIDPAKSMGRAESGVPPPGPQLEPLHPVSPRSSFQEGVTLEIPATTHLSIVDAEGNAVAMTSSIEAGFGSRIMVGGFLLNNQLTDFSFAAERAADHTGKLIANRLEPGKRPLSSMAPTVVFDAQDQLWAVLGSSGGARIINYVAQTLVALVDGHLAPDIAVSLPHVGSRNGPTEIELGYSNHVNEVLAAQLAQRGHIVREAEMTSGTHVIVRNPQGKGWLGAADPRREGRAVGG